MTAGRRFLAWGAAAALALACNCPCAAPNTARPGRARSRGTRGELRFRAVTPIDLATGKAQPAMRVGKHPDAIVAGPDGRTVYVANGGSSTVTPISVATGTIGRAIRVATDPVALAMVPDGRTVYVACETSGRGTVVPISTSTSRAGKPIRSAGTRWPSR